MVREPDAEKDPLEHQAWERCNDLVISWILFNLEPKVAKSVLHIKSATSMWVDLGDSYDRCFKVHGYPPGFKPYKDRRVAAMSHVQSYENYVQDGADESQVSVSDSSGVPFTTAQYSYLMGPIQNRGAVNESQADVEGSGQAMLTGPCSEKASLSSW